ncbi:MAG: hypothetical protein KGO52_16325 [Nitrospirota bacterium]|nr:hypothetical protein [Nitrospirota bacterium]
MKLSTVRLRVADLGFADGALTREIIGSERDRDLFGHLAPFTGGRSNQLGLELCSPEVGPEFRLQYDNQPLGERVYIAMKPITASDGEPRIFVVEHNSNGLSLDATRARPDDEWSPEAIFLFCRREKTAAEETRD